MQEQPASSFLLRKFCVEVPERRVEKDTK